MISNYQYSQLREKGEVTSQTPIIEFALNRDLTLVCEPKRLALVNCKAQFNFASFEYLLRLWERIQEASMIAQIFA